MADFHLTIVTPQGNVLDDNVESVAAPGVDGYFGVFNQHAPIISSLKSGVVTVRSNSVEIYFAISSGVLEVEVDTRVLILTDTALEANNKEDAIEKLNELQSAISA